MRKLKLDSATMARLLDDIDALDARTETASVAAGPSFPYRVPALRVDFDFSRDQSDSLIVPSRKLGAKGIHFLVGGLVHLGHTCRIHLVTVRNNWQTVSGKVAKCRYLPGTNGVHEVFVRFDRPIDPASFAASATRSRILAADDSQVSLKLYERLLDSMNVDLTCVNNAVEAVDCALNDKFDLLLIDFEMPDMDGLQAVKILRSKGYVRSIIVVSALSDEEQIARCLAAGADDFLAKPLTRDSLEEVVTRNKSEPLVSAMLDDPSMFELIDNFVAGLAINIAQLEAAYGEKNLEALEKTARAVKGEAAGVGFASITDAAATVEMCAKTGDDWEHIRSRVTELIRLCMSARPATTREEEGKPEEADAANSADGNSDHAEAQKAEPRPAETVKAEEQA